MKSITHTGRLTADPEVKAVGDGNIKVANFSLANNDSDKTDGEFYEVCCWDKLAVFAENYLKKGNRILVNGTFNNEKYLDKEGKPRVRFKITAYKAEFAE